MTLIAIDAPHFCAGVVTNHHGIVKQTAPILAYMKGWPEHRLRRYCEGKGWQAVAVPANDSLPAGAPMTFACAVCLAPITVPECYVNKPRLCPSCGGGWSR